MSERTNHLLAVLVAAVAIALILRWPRARNPDLSKAIEQLRQSGSSNFVLQFDGPGGSYEIVLSNRFDATIHYFPTAKETNQ